VIVSSALPLIVGEPDRPIAWHKGRPVTRAQFERQVNGVAARLPSGGAMINLCEQRYNFLVAYGAALAVGQTTLLPPSRAEQVVAEVEQAHRRGYRFDDAAVLAAEEGDARSVAIPRDHVAMIGLTSGSTGQPQQHAKRWYSVTATSGLNERAIRDALGLADGAVATVIATVPSQHMYGMELSVLLPLLGNMAVHSGRPLFPADLAAALAEVEGPRVVVSTPVHLRALIQSDVRYPPVSLLVSATAPLDQALAQAIESRFEAPLLEMFGATETCIFARRRTALEQAWTLYEGAELLTSESVTHISAPWLAHPTPLLDVMEKVGPDRFIVRGRSADLIDVAGKRASLSDLTRRLLSLEGVQDAVVFQPEAAAGTVTRVAALVVAPGRSTSDLNVELARMIDSAFMPRPLLCVERLPRNETGKLPRSALLDLLARSVERGSSGMEK
jgi:acyl-coenzyme A synthetase/AMP-(fatty) acid ligase